MIIEQPPKKPTYRELWWDQGATLLDLWQGGTKLDEHTLSLLWNHSLVPSYVAEQALHEYNSLFGTSYTLEQVNIPTLESLGYGRRFHTREGETSMAVGWTWEYYGS
jgi:hypothetical protein